MPLPDEDKRFPALSPQSPGERQQRSIMSTLQGSSLNSVPSKVTLTLPEVVRGFNSSEQNVPAPSGPFMFLQQQELLVPETRGLDLPQAPVFSETMSRLTVELAHSDAFGAPLISDAVPPRFSTKIAPEEPVEKQQNSAGELLALHCSGLAAHFSEVFARARQPGHDDAAFMAQFACKRDVFAELGSLLHQLPAMALAHRAGFKTLRFPTQTYADVFSLLVLCCLERDADVEQSWIKQPPSTTACAQYFGAMSHIQLFGAVDAMFGDLLKSVFAALEERGLSWSAMADICHKYRPTLWRRSNEDALQASQPVSQLRPRSHAYNDFITSKDAGTLCAQQWMSDMAVDLSLACVAEGVRFNGCILSSSFYTRIAQEASMVDRRLSVVPTEQQTETQQVVPCPLTEASEALLDTLPPQVETAAASLALKFGKGMGMNYYELLAAGSTQSVQVLPSIAVELEEITHMPPPSLPSQGHHNNHHHVASEVPLDVSKLRNASPETVADQLRACEYNFFFLSLQPLLSSRSWTAAPAALRAWFSSSTGWTLCPQPSILGGAGCSEQTSALHSSQIENHALSTDAQSRQAQRVEPQPSDRSSRIVLVPPQPAPFVVFPSVAQYIAPQFKEDPALLWTDANTFLLRPGHHSDLSRLPAMQLYSSSSKETPLSHATKSLADFRPITSTGTLVLSYQVPITSCVRTYQSLPSDYSLLQLHSKHADEECIAVKEQLQRSVRQEWASPDGLHFFPDSLPIPALLSTVGTSHSNVVVSSSDRLLPFFSDPLQRILSTSRARTFTCKRLPVNTGNLEQAKLVAASHSAVELVVKGNTGYAADSRNWFNPFSGTVCAPIAALSVESDKYSGPDLEPIRATLRSVAAQSTEEPVLVSVQAPVLVHPGCISCVQRMCTSIVMSGLAVLCVSALNKAPIIELPAPLNTIPCSKHASPNSISPIHKLTAMLESQVFSAVHHHHACSALSIVNPAPNTPLPCPVTPHVLDMLSQQEYTGFRGHYSPSDLEQAAMQSFLPYHSYFPPLRSRPLFSKLERMMRWTKKIDQCNNEHIIVPVLKRDHWVLVIINNAKLWKQRHARARLAVAVFQQEVQLYQQLVKHWKPIRRLVLSMLGTTRKVLPTNKEVLKMPRVPPAVQSAYEDAVNAIKLLYNGESSMLVFDSMTHNLSEEESAAPSAVTTVPTPVFTNPAAKQLRTGGSYQGRRHRMSTSRPLDVSVAEDPLHVDVDLEEEPSVSRRTPRQSTSITPTLVLSPWSSTSRTTRSMTAYVGSQPIDMSEESPTDDLVAPTKQTPIRKKRATSVDLRSSMSDVIVDLLQPMQAVKTKDISNVSDASASSSSYDDDGSESSSSDSVMKNSNESNLLGKAYVASNSPITVDSSSEEESLNVKEAEVISQAKDTSKKRIRSLDESSDDDDDDNIVVDDDNDDEMQDNNTAADLSDTSAQLPHYSNSGEQILPFSNIPTTAMPLSDHPFIHTALYNQGCVVRPAYLAANEVFSNVATLLDRQWTDDRLNAEASDSTTLATAIYKDSSLVMRVSTDISLRDPEFCKLSEAEQAFVSRTARAVYQSVIRREKSALDTMKQAMFPRLLSAMFSTDKENVYEDTRHGLDVLHKDYAQAQANLLDPCEHGVIRPFFAALSAQRRKRPSETASDCTPNPVSPRSPQCPGMCELGCVCGAALITSQLARIAHVYTQARSDGLVLRLNAALKLIRQKVPAGVVVRTRLAALQSAVLARCRRAAVQGALLRAATQSQAPTPQCRTDNVPYSTISLLSLLPPTSSFQYIPCSYVDVPQQGNPDDCGPLLVAYAQAFINKPFTLRGGASMLTKPYVNFTAPVPNISATPCVVPKSPLAPTVRAPPTVSVTGDLPTHVVAAHVRCQITAAVYSQIIGPATELHMNRLVELISSQYLALNSSVLQSPFATTVLTDMTIFTSKTRPPTPPLLSLSSDELYILLYCDFASIQASLYQHISPFMLLCKIRRDIFTVQVGMSALCTEHANTPQLLGAMHAYAALHGIPCVQPKPLVCTSTLCGIKEEVRKFTASIKDSSANEASIVLLAGTLPPMNPLDLYLLKLVHEAITFGAKLLVNDAPPISTVAAKGHIKNLQRAIMYQTVTASHVIPSVNQHAREVLNQLKLPIQIIHSHEPFIMTEVKQK